MMMMIPEAWAGNPLMDEERRAFYEYNAALMEPWDGPAAIAFTNGRQIGATLDRNGLRPARYFAHRRRPHRHGVRDGRAADPGKGHRQEVAAAAGQDAAGRSRRGPPHSRRGIEGDAGQEPSLQGVARRAPRSCSRRCRAPPTRRRSPNLSLLDRQQAFGYTQEDLKFLMTPMATTGEEAVGSMGNDTPISALSDKPKSLFTYFKQNFAQVTNPPIDPIREELVMSLVSIIGPRPNLLDLEGTSNTQAPRSAPADPHQRRPGEDPLHRRHERRPLPVAHLRHHLSGRARRRRHGLARSTHCASAPKRRCASGCNIIILSDRKPSPTASPIPALLACAAVHHHLIRKGLRTSVGLVRGDRRAARGASLRAASPATAPRRSTPISPSRRWSP